MSYQGDIMFKSCDIFKYVLLSPIFVNFISFFSSSFFNNVFGCEEEVPVAEDGVQDGDKPSPEYITQKLSEQGVTMATFDKRYVRELEKENQYYRTLVPNRYNNTPEKIQHNHGVVNSELCYY